MTQSSNADFLRQAYANNWQRYLESLRTKTRSGWDICVLTASDERQAAMYRRQLQWRREADLLPPATEFRVIADPGGLRIGSGSATLRALVELQVDSAAFDTRRTLIIHSGGDSRRLPQCSIVGKLFARLPRELPDGRASTIFDEFLISLSGLATVLPPGVLIASGDVLLVFDHLQLSLRRSGVTGVAAAAPADMGTQHGVYVRSQGTHRVQAYLHKPSPQRMLEWNAIAADGSVQIDTGLVWFDAPTARSYSALAGTPAISKLCRLYPGEPPSVGSALNLYGDLLLPLAQSTALAGYLADASDGPATSDVQSARQHIWAGIRGIPFSVEALQPAMFIHFGTSHQYWQTVAADPALRSVCGWTSQVASWPGKTATPALDHLVLVNTVIEGPLVHTETLMADAKGGAQKPADLLRQAQDDRLVSEQANQAALIVDSQLGGTLSWRGAAIIANTLSDQSIALESDVVLHQVILDNGFVTRTFGLHDDPKQVWDAPIATFMNRSWLTWLAAARLDPAIIWPDIAPAARTLWNAKLYPVNTCRDASLQLALLLQHPEQLAQEPSQWQSAPRLSLQESFATADGERVLADISAVEDNVAAQHFFHTILSEAPAAQARELLGHNQSAVSRRCELLKVWIGQTDQLTRLRGYQALAVATGNTAFEDQAFHTLADMVQLAVTRPAHTPRASGRKSVIQHRAVRVEAAARIDFGGGWSDTPPYSIERGGTVLNAALTLSPHPGGEKPYPIVAEVTLLDEPTLRLNSQDIEAVIEPEQVGDLLAYANPADPFALHKAALVMHGIVAVNEDPQRPVADVMRSLGHGLCLTTQTSIPRGSGLGTSSIMAGAVLACLAEMTGHAPAHAQLFDEVLALEQMLTTGGGWQDQVGGLLGGIKLITTEPGLPQVIHAEPLHLTTSTQAELGARLQIVYTGQQRLAKNLLQVIVAKWMAREPAVARSLGEIAQLALDMRMALQQGDITAFGELLGQHWLINKRMDPGCTNPFIDGLFDLARPYVNGGKLAGAGGGGFAIMIARDAQAARKLAGAVASRYQDSPVSMWWCAIPELGMAVHKFANSHTGASAV
jgi:fucokinase